jgi:pimeloyl-ACP methyl ester carboxylesterase
VLLRLCLVLLLLVAAPTATALDYRFFESDGARLAYTDYGAGTPVIFLHGFEGNFAFLEPTANSLGEGFRVIGLDQRGHGRSDKPHDGDAYGKRMADDVLNLMDRLHLQQAHLVGHSMGGIVAMYLVANHPERFLSTVTIGNGLFSHGELTLIGWLFRGMFAWSDVKQLFAADSQAPSPERDRTALLLVVRNLKDLAITQAQAAAIRVPLLAMRGGPKDDPHDTVERLAAVNPSAKMIRIEAEDHVSILANKQFQGALKEFLAAASASVPPSAAAPGSTTPQR